MKMQSLRLIAATWALLLLVACGGGGSVSREENTGGSTPDPSYSVSLTLADSDGNTSTSLTGDSPLILSATVTDSDGSPVANTVVTFSFTVANLARFSNDTGTALTNDEGVATITLIVGELSGSGAVEAALETGETTRIGFSSSGTTATVETPESLELFASQSQLSSSGSDEVEVWAVVKNAQNILLDGVNVTFSADNNAAIAETQPVTDENGTAIVMLRTGGDKENRTINVTATVSGEQTLTETISINVVGTEIEINGTTSAIIGDSVNLTVSLQDSDNVGIASETLTLRVEDESGTDVTATTLDDAAPQTSAEGRATVAFTAPAAGTFTVFANALNTESTFAIEVQQDEFVFVNAPDVNDVDQDIPLNTDYNLQVSWLRDAAPFAGGSISFAISRGTVVSADAVTDGSGIADLTVSSGNAGLATISATGTDGAGVQVSTQIEIAFIATDAETIIVDATPDSIGPDGQTSTISAVVLDADGNRVRNKLVNFEVNDVSNGNLTDAQSRTDRRGIATTVYESNAVSTYQSVEVRAYVNDEPAVEDSTLLTVGDRPFDISLGTGNLIEAPQQSSYRKEFSVFVTDADANPVSGAALTFSATPVAETTNDPAYAKGYWLWDEDDSIYYSVVTATCANEDLNGNGRLDVGEDFNGDGQLTPGNVGAIDADANTDENGQALINLNYPKQYGAWVQLAISARGESSGTESVDSMNYWLSVSTDDRSTQGAPPPSSPWGVSANCGDTL
ncbi:MAG TPA: invasin [Alteromonas sp.]|nr:invasin [Alteromonas sp.]HCB18642.1 invasin [Alteromonas sp.]HCV17276.1 invasin [Alteromonas sp.]|tara:strand:- start:13725 stop:15947 length:2223 start_codon:yes stop_codon:yes gene_type:complete